MSDLTPDVASSATPQPEPTYTVAERAAMAGDQGAYREARAAERGGKPLPTPADSSADAASAEPDDQAASTDASSKPASEPGTKDGHKGNADTRIKELLADRAKERERAERLEREIAEIRQKVTPTTQPTRAASAAAPAKPSDDDPEPQLKDFEADPEKYPDPYTAHLRAVARWEGRQEFKRAQAARDQQTRAQEAEAREVSRVETFRGRLKAAKEADPAWFDSLSDEVKNLKPIGAAKAAGEPITPLHAVCDEVMDSEVAPQIMSYLSAHPEEVQRLAQIPNPRALLRAMGRIEALATAPKPTPALTPAKTVTEAPPPPRTLGTRPADPSDDVASLVRNSDLAGLKALKQREWLAKQVR